MPWRPREGNLGEREAPGAGLQSLCSGAAWLGPAGPCCPSLPLGSSCSSHTERLRDYCHWGPLFLLFHLGTPFLLAR